MTIRHEEEPAKSGCLPVQAGAYWETIGAFVTDAVTEAAAASDRTARSLYPATTAFVLWCWQTRGTPLERERIFRDTVIQEFVHRGMASYSTGSRATHRATLMMMAAILVPTAKQWRLRPLPRSAPTAPYNIAEVAELYSWAVSQTTFRRRQDALALLALGLGAGLATREILGVRAGDIDTRTGQLEVIVWESRPRVVPVSAEWQAILFDLLNTVAASEWLFRQRRSNMLPSHVANFVRRTNTTLDVRPSRMRATWLLAQLLEGTPPLELLRISGLANFAALDKIICFDPRARGENRRVELA